MKIISQNFRQTQKIGELLGKEIKKSDFGLKETLVIALESDLGGGKTTFIQGLAKGLGIKTSVLSPTFVILKKFEFDKGHKRYFYHVDCYRLDGPQYLLDLGFKEIINNPHNIIAIEWADRVRKICPKKMLRVKLKWLGKDKRGIDMTS